MTLTSFLVLQRSRRQISCFATGMHGSRLKFIYRALSSQELRIPIDVKVVEVGPRDGLQNEKVPISTDVKIGLIDRLSNAGLRTIEAASFVSPKWVPQMADGAAVMAGIHRKPGVKYQALVPNVRGFDAALAAKVDEVSIFASASETFSERNINCGMADSLLRLAPVCEAARARGIPIRGYVSCALGCPYEGHVSPVAVARMAASLAEMGCYEISIADTIGVGTPAEVLKALHEVRRAIPLSRVAVHFHDTYGQALVNTLVALQEGVTVVDASVGGLGGCPYAPGAAGNLSTEDLVHMLHGCGVSTGIDARLLLEASEFICGALGRPPSSRAARALMSTGGGEGRGTK